MNSSSDKKRHCNGVFSAGKTKKMKPFERSWILLTVALFVFMLFVTLAVRPAYSKEGTDVGTDGIALGVSPSNIIDYSLGPNGNFTVNINALNVSSLHGFQLTLGYSAAVINCTAVREGDLLKSGGNTTEHATIDNVGGIIDFSLSLNSAGAEASGNGSLVMLDFHVMSRGETFLRLQEVDLYDAYGASLSYVAYNGYFNNRFLVDVAMPLALLCVTLASMFLNQRAESKLKVTLEDKELGTRDVVTLVGLMIVMISSVVFFRELIAPLMVLFLFSYSMLLFIFTYLFSRRHWYIAAVPPAVFILLYLFLRDTSIWSNYLISIYGVVFAILVTLYVGSLFSWKPTLIFAALLTTVDVILVLVTGTMVQAANTTFKTLSLPVMVAVPVVPPIGIVGGLLSMALGIGDFFFAGLLAIQTFKKFGRKTAVISVLAMVASFFVFETLLLTFWRTGFPGTLMIICGWLPIVAGKLLKDRYSKS